MIEINLLPEDLKKRARAGSGVHRTMVLCVALLLVAAVGAAYFHVVPVGGRRARNERQGVALAKLRKDTAELPTLEGAIRRIEQRKNALTALHRERMLWAVKLDEIVDIVPENVWVRTIRLDAPRRVRVGSASGGTLSLDCYSAGTEEKGVTLFRDRLREHEQFWADVAWINRPNITRRPFPAYVEGEALDFTVELRMKSRKPPAPKAPRRRTRTASRR